MKEFTMVKVGYTAGYYGCSGEQFVAQWRKSEKKSGVIRFEGMYGAEQRLSQELKNKGFKENYIPSYFGKMTRKEVKSYGFVSEQKALEEIRAL